MYYYWKQERKGDEGFQEIGHALLTLMVEIWMFGMIMCINWLHLI